MEFPPDPLSSERYLTQLLRDVSREDLGRRIKTHRMNAGLSIRELSARAMVSKTSVVALEQGKGCRPATLEKICRGMRLHVERLAKGEPETTDPVHRQDQAQWFELDGLVSGPVAGAAGAKNLMLMFGNVPSDAGFIAGVVEVNQPSDARSHSGAEFGYVIQGTVQVQIEGQTHTVRVGESFFVPDGALHAYGVEDGGSAKVLLFRLT